ncbi:hypothetical protein RIB2604_02100530 [Aspergillus luchuensis]|uniref:Uncharacterized protein n=1 Tax=Aspergillus kawachii TaxID=1069201 RepID=A0A146FL14_ASPKA|nr:hypothetical protein RIB2604_02100530 [Aspergillus luchuensis]
MFPTRVLRMQASRPFAFPAPFHRSVAVGAAIYSSTRKLMTDKTLRLYRNSPEDREH